MNVKPLALLILATLLAPASADDETNFSATPPGTWQRYAPLSILGLGNFNFTGGVARLTCGVPAVSTFGPARLALFAPTTYTQTVVSADLIAWSSARNIPGIIARAGNIGLGTTRGYSFGFIPSTGETAIHRLTGEIPTPISTVTFIPVIPGRSYRIVLICAGSNITGRIFDLTDLSTPVIELNAVDSTYTSGVTGILNSADTAAAIDATFDNYLAWDGTPPTLTITPGAGTVTISANALRSLSTNLETTDDLATPFLQYFPGAVISGALLQNTVPMDAPQRFYRRRLVGSQ